MIIPSSQRALEARSRGTFLSGDKLQIVEGRSLHCASLRSARSGRRVIRETPPMCALCGVLGGSVTGPMAAARPGVFTRNVDGLQRGASGARSPARAACSCTMA